ncbi:MAG: tRNA-binding protein [Pseudomonadota bacterium]
MTAQSTGDDEIDIATFAAVDIRIGTIVEASIFAEARKPALKLAIDFGPAIGIRKSSAQIRDLYDPDTLIGTQIIAVVNFPPRQIGPIMSEVLTLGVPDEDGRIVLMRPDRPVPPGSRLS